MKVPSSRGFTLIELLVVIAIIGILATVVLVALSGARLKSRDAQRLSELKEMQKALELYYSTNGRYPVTVCAAPDLNWTSFDSATYSSRKTCTKSGLAGVNTLTVEMAPYISALNDPKNLGTDSGFLYSSAPNGQSYCFMSYRTPEDLTNYPASFVNPGRCGSGNSMAQCSSAGTYGGPNNAVFVGTGAFATAGC